MVLYLTVRTFCLAAWRVGSPGGLSFCGVQIGHRFLLLGAELMATVEAGDLDLVCPDATGDGSGQAAGQEDPRSGFSCTKAFLVCGEGSGAALGAAGHPSGLIILDPLFRLAVLCERRCRALHSRGQSGGGRGRFLCNRLSWGILRSSLVMALWMSGVRALLSGAM